MSSSAVSLHCSIKRSAPIINKRCCILAASLVAITLAVRVSVVKSACKSASMNGFSSFKGRQYQIVTALCVIQMCWIIMVITTSPPPHVKTNKRVRSGWLSAGFCFWFISKVFLAPQPVTKKPKLSCIG